MAKLELRYINIMGMDKKLVDGFYFRDLLVNLLEYDEFVKEVDKITGSKIASKKTLEKRQEELNMIIHNGARGAITMNLAIKYLSYLADQALEGLIDIYWKDKMSEFKGFGNGKRI